MSGTGGILGIWNDREDSIAQVYEQWYVREHVPERLAVPGFMRARRYESCTGASPRFFTFYELDSVDILSSEAYLARLAAPSELTREVMAHFRNMLRTAFISTHRSAPAASGACVVVSWVCQPATVDETLMDAAFTECERQPGVIAVQSWRAAPDAGAVSVESKLRPGGDRKAQSVLLADVMREGEGIALAPVMHALFEAAVAGPADLEVTTGVFRLLGSWEAAR